MNWGDLWHYPFLPAVWGTVSSWAGALSFVAGAVYFIADRWQDRRSQASSVYVAGKDESAWIVIRNSSDKPISNVQAVPKIMGLWTAARMHEFEGAVMLGSETVAAYPSHEFYLNSKSMIKRMRSRSDQLRVDLSATDIAGGAEAEVMLHGLLSGGVQYFVTFRDARGLDWSLNIATKRLRQIKVRWWTRVWRWAKGSCWSLWWIGRNEAVAIFRKMRGRGGSR